MTGLEKPNKVSLVDKALSIREVEKMVLACGEYLFYHLCPGKLFLVRKSAQANH